MKKISLLLLIALCSLFSLIYLDSSKAQSAQDPAKLFSLIGVEKMVDSENSPSRLSVAAVREREISINFDNINFEMAPKLSLPLLDGKSHLAVRREQEGFVRLGADEFSWRGKITGANGWSGDVILTVKDKSLSGLIYSEAAVYEIIPQANFTHVLVEIDQSRFPPCAGAITLPENEPSIETGIPANNGGGLMTSSDAVAPDDGSLIDVLVVYTAQVRTALGGTTQTQAFIQQSISSTNTAYQNSGISPRLRLAAAQEVTYDESAGTLSAGLNWVRNDLTVAAARNTAKADLVALIVEGASDGCGLASVQRTVGAAFASRAFSATARGCAVSNLSFAHELGHNEGCEHNPENGMAPSDASYPYAFGHYVNGAFRTVMSYADPCTSGCVRVPYFSNPLVNFNGFATGIVNERDNRRVINNTALIVSQFRESGGGTTPTPTPPQGQPNLTPFQPSGWSDKIVVSKATGTSTDSSPLTPADTLYIDWSVINNGDGATAATFSTKLYVDGVERQTWTTSPPLNANFYSYIQDYSIGQLSAGQHTIKIVTDTTGAIAEKNESDNEYSRVITVSSATAPNLTPYQPLGWSDKLVISTTTAINIDAPSLLSTDTLYIDWAVINNGDASTSATFTTRLYIDGAERQAWTTPPPLNQNFYTYVQDYPLGSLSAGQHTIRIVTDAGGAISEKNEADNEYTKVISVGAAPVGSAIQFAAQSYSFNEASVNTGQGFGTLNISVERTEAAVAATVQYFTTDQSGGNECNQATGFASQRCDYAAQGGTVRFAAGEASKQIQIPIINDGYIEGPEVFSIRLQNPVGAALGTNIQATITIIDRNVATTPQNNPYLSNEFFVRMNYLDFLAREPDAGGWTTWPPLLNGCGPEKGFLGAPYSCDRAHVSHGFYGSPEFTNRGFLIYRMYEVGMGRLPRFAEFTPDMATLSGFGLSDSVLQQNLQDYLQRFAAKTEFTNRFQDALQPSQAATLILKLEQTAGITLPASAVTNPGQPTQYGRQELINLRANGILTVGQTLKAFVEQQAVYDKYFPRGAVTMEYFAYLKRDPDLNDPQLLGWTEWVFVFTNGGAQRGRPDIQPRDIHHLIFGFIYSEEYRKRFGAP